MKRSILLLLCGIVVLTGCQKKAEAELQQQQMQNKCAGCLQATDCAESTQPKAKITFVELGSVNCIPCKAMQPVMKAIEEKYGDQINVVFYDVWKEEQKKYAEEYKIKLIPTQVFLDENGKEIMRHEGFFPEKEIDAFLQKQGLEPKKTS